jgi:hypothetical protein
VTEIIELLRELFRPARATKQFSRATKPFPAFGAEIRKQPLVMSLTTQTAGQRRHPERRQSMRTLSFILAVAFVVAGSSMAGSSEAGLPGIGTFAYNGSPIAASAAQAVVVAAR